MDNKKRRAAAGCGSIRKKTVTRNGKAYEYWEARYTTGYDPKTGKQRQRSISGKSLTDVRNRMQLACVGLSEGTYIQPIKILLRDWLNTWLQDFTKGIKPSTQYSYQKIIRTHIIPGIGAVQLQKLSSQIIQEFLNELSDSKGLSPKTVKNVYGVLHKALKQAVILRYIKSNPAEGCELPKVKKPTLTTLDDSMIIDFLKAIQGHKFENVYLIALFTGMRQGEILGLTWDCIDFNTSTITVKQQLQLRRDGSKEYVLVPTKSGRTRQITVPKSVIGILGIEKNRSASEFVFTNDDGKPLSATTVYKNFKRLVSAAGLSSLRFHDLRHGYAVAALRAGDDIKTLQENLGHYSAAFTLDVYGYVTAQMKQESAVNMEQYISDLIREK